MYLSSFHGKRAEPFLFLSGDHSAGGMSAEVRAPPPSTLFCALRYMSTFGELASKSPRVSSWWFDPIWHCFPRPCPTGDPPCHGPSPPLLPTWVSNPLPQFALSLCQSSPPPPPSPPHNNCVAQQVNADKQDLVFMPQCVSGFRGCQFSLCRICTINLQRRAA